MQTARSTLKLKMPVHAIVPRLPQKQVVVVDQNMLQQKASNVEFTKDVKANAQNKNTAKVQ